MEPAKKAWAEMTLDEVRRTVAARFDVGLTSEEVSRRVDIYGNNTLEKGDESGLLGKIVAQIRSPLVFILLIAGVVTLGIEEYLDSIVIFIALTINVVMGTLQEERASKAFEKLNTSQEHRAVVIRDGKRENIDSANLVPGDVVLLEGGYFVPADLRLFEAKDLKINEAALTGEWLAVHKDTEPVLKGTPLAEKHGMAWMGTLIESGYGRGVVVATGGKTEVGEIARQLGTIHEQVTPLQGNIRRVARFLTYVVAAALVGIFILGVLREEPLGELILVAIAVAVATLPSGLPAAVTIVLAIGMESILKRGGLVRNLLAAETLGATTVILTDKTGTLTEARMKLAALYSYEGVKAKNETPVGDNRFLLELGVLASDAFIEEAEDAPRKLTVHGRPIEKAVVVSGLEAGVAQDQVLTEYPRLDYLQFTSARRFGASLHENPHKKTNRLVVSGVPEMLLEKADYIRYENKRDKATAKEKKLLADLLTEKTSEGKRIIAVAYRDASFTEIPVNDENPDDILKGLIFGGFLAFEDPIRTDVQGAIEEVQGAGAQVIMLTGDNPETARHIAASVGITKPGDELVIRGDEIDEWSDEELFTKLQSIRVIARAVPAHKLRIARVLKNNGEVVAMTGDGVNDAPALRAASIGVAVGSGTEVAKEASDLVLINNSFSIIVAAIEEGRRIIDNLKKIIAYLLSTSFSEIFVISGALIGGAPLPLLPTQILWGKIVEEGLMSFSFAFEKKDPTAMKRDPRASESTNIMSREIKLLIVLVSIVTGTFLIALYYWLLHRGLPIEEIRTIMFVALSLDAIFFTFSLKSLDTPIWRINPFSNRYLIVALCVSITLLFGVFFVEPLKNLLSLTSLTAFDKGLLVLVGLVNLGTIEIMKYVFFERRIIHALIEKGKGVTGA
jgi:calcium-translocating P-type ATPase